MKYYFFSYIAQKEGAPLLAGNTIISTPNPAFPVGTVCMKYKEQHSYKLFTIISYNELSEEEYDFMKENFKLLESE